MAANQVVTIKLSDIFIYDSKYTSNIKPSNKYNIQNSRANGWPALTITYVTSVFMCSLLDRIKQNLFCYDIPIDVNA